jgi:hypothetical protein
MTRVVEVDGIVSTYSIYGGDNRRDRMFTVKNDFCSGPTESTHHDGCLMGEGYKVSYEKLSVTDAKYGLAEIANVAYSENYLRGRTGE